MKKYGLYHEVSGFYLQSTQGVVISFDCLELAKAQVHNMYLEERNEQLKKGLCLEERNELLKKEFRWRVIDFSSMPHEDSEKVR